MSSPNSLRLLFSRTHQFTLRRPFLRQHRNQIFRRYQQTVAGTPTVEGAPAAHQSLLQRLWTSEVGVKTVHFWSANPLQLHCCLAHLARSSTLQKRGDCHDKKNTDIEWDMTVGHR